MGCITPVRVLNPDRGRTNKTKLKAIPRQPKPDCSGNPFSFILLKEKDCSVKREDIILRRDKRPFQIIIFIVSLNELGVLPLSGFQTLTGLQERAIDKGL